MEVITIPSIKKKPAPLELPAHVAIIDSTLAWKLWHALNILIGDLCFLIGSIMIYPNISKQVQGDILSGWLYTVGSLCFLFGDLTECYHYREGFLAKTKCVYINNSLYATFRRAELGLNSFISVLSSLLYLIGSVMFIPSVMMTSDGIIYVIIASFLMFISYAWKCFRWLFTVKDDGREYLLEWKNIYNNLLCFNADFWACTGGFLFGVGTIMLMNASTNLHLDNAAHVYVVSCCSMSLSGVLVQFIYFWPNFKSKSIGEHKIVSTES